MKDLRQSIITDVKDLTNENMTEFMKKIAVSIKRNIVESMKTQTGINNQTYLTPMSQPEPITQYSPHPTP